MIDPRAVIDARAEIAADVEIGPFAIIGAGVSIAAGCRIGPHAVVLGPARLGPNNHVYQFASIGDAPQDKKYKGEPTRLEIGAGNTFREYCTVNRGTTHDQGVTRIGDDNWFMAYTHVAHDCQVGSHCILANLATLGGHVELGDWVIMAGFSGVHQFCKIGAHCFVANNAAVTRDVPPYLMVTGQPAVPHSVNSEGLKRRGFTPEQIRNIRNAFRILYRSDLKLAEAAGQIEALAANQPELAPYVEFLAASKRSIVR
jgi:UDP-N-acetylglucosamine acyltransferase